MEQKAPIFAKRLKKFVRVLYFMLRKGISKSKLLHDLNKMMKRGRIATKSLLNLMFHNNNCPSTIATNNHNMSPGPPSDEYEFSCTNSPSTNNYHHTFSLFPFHKKQHRLDNHSKEEIDMIAINVAVWKAMEMNYSETASPMNLGYGKSPMVRQLRVTDSPFPLISVDEDNHVVDEAAERFISRFYNDLRKQD
ncbi:uncharacterized protein [Rutidosis leptorrhynchoides]|uniref:uncharacterized protein n=1 Tax=Rutidosis leptorrhynchoides TaxID=125765 RepID=UPI003A99CC23